MSAVAVAACLSSMSPGVYIALMNEKGDDFDCPSVLAVKILDSKKAYEIYNCSHIFKIYFVDNPEQS